MAEPEDATVLILRDIQNGIAGLGRDVSAIKDELRRQGVRLDELAESSAMAPGLAGHANTRHDTVRRELDDLAKRVERLEKQS